MGSKADVGSVCSNLYQQAEEIVSTLDKLSTRFADPAHVIGDGEASQSLEYLRSDLLRLSGDLEMLKTSYTRHADRTTETSHQQKTPYLVSGVALGMVLGKLLGSE